MIRGALIESGGPMTASFTNEAMSAAVQLREYLKRGGEPAAQQPSLRLYQDEEQFFSSGFRLFAYEDREVHYTQIKGNFSPGGLAISAAAAPLNVLFKSNAKRRARPKWRETTRGVLYATNQRLVLGSEHRLVDWDHGALATVELMPLGVYAAYHGADASILDVGPQVNPWFYVLLSYLGLGIRDVQL
jgi:hypothetical protein